LLCFSGHLNSWAANSMLNKISHAANLFDEGAYWIQQHPVVGVWIWLFGSSANRYYRKQLQETKVNSLSSKKYEVVDDNTVSEEPLPCSPDEGATSKKRLNLKRNISVTDHLSDLQQGSRRGKNENQKDQRSKSSVKQGFREVSQVMIAQKGANHGGYAGSRVKKGMQGTSEGTNVITKSPGWGWYIYISSEENIYHHNHGGSKRDICHDGNSSSHQVEETATVIKPPCCALSSSSSIKKPEETNGYYCSTCGSGGGQQHETALCSFIGSSENGSNISHCQDDINQEAHSSGGCTSPIVGAAIDNTTRRNSSSKSKIDYYYLDQ